MSAAWTKEPLVAALDGPMRGHWYTEAEWRERITAAERMIAKGQRAESVLSYARTDQRVEHPEHPGVFGTAWQLRPGGAE